MVHFIYHIPGRKVGCTDNLERRTKQYPTGTEIVVLEKLEGKSDKEAGDVEWKWADHFCYPRGFHYIHSSSQRAYELVEKLGVEGVKARSAKAMKTMGAEGLRQRAFTNANRQTPEIKMAKAKKLSDFQIGIRDQSSSRQKQAMANRTPEERSAIAFKGQETRRLRAQQSKVVS